MTETQLKGLIKACVKTLNEGFLGLDRKELNEILNLRTIHGVSTLDKLAITKKHRLEIYHFIMRKYRWILNFEYPVEEKQSWSAPFRHFFKDGGESYEDWVYDFRATIWDELNNFKHWIKNHEAATSGNPRWLANYKIIQEIAKKYPTFERDLTNLLEYVDTFNHKTAESPLNPENYPIYVSLYSGSRQFGGQEEGGWYYRHMQYIDSIKVNSYKEARIAAIKLLKNMTMGFEGTQVILEKTPKCLETRERPHYS